MRSSSQLIERVPFSSPNSSDEAFLLRLPLRPPSLIFNLGTSLFGVLAPPADCRLLLDLDLLALSLDGLDFLEDFRLDFFEGLSSSSSSSKSQTSSTCFLGLLRLAPRPLGFSSSTSSTQIKKIYIYYDFIEFFHFLMNLFSNFSCLFLNLNNFFKFEF